jgi:hypothetical protein
MDFSEKTTSFDKSCEKTYQNFHIIQNKKEKDNEIK